MTNAKECQATPTDVNDRTKVEKAPHFDFSGITPQYVIKECLLGVTIGCAQIPESVAFAYMAHIKPPIALHAAWMVGLICSLFGGRPGMVNGATGAFAAIISTFLPMPDKTGGNGEGIELLFPSVMLAGIFMFIVSVTRLSRFILLLPSPVMIGFCNGLAVVIGMSQLHPFYDPDTHELKKGLEVMWMTIIMLVAMATMEFLPWIPLKIGKVEVFKVIPSSLMAIFSAVFIQYCIVKPTGSNTNTIGDVSEFTSDTAFPIPFFVKHDGYVYNYDKLDPNKNNEMFSKILTQGFLLAVVGTIESLMTSEVVESFVKTPSEGDKTVAAMGVGNLLSGFMGGMGVNAMIGLSTINVLNGGKGRLAPTCTALVVMAATMGAYQALNVIPVAALSGIMIVVVLHTFKWFSLKIVIASVMPATMRKSMTGIGFFGDFNEKIPRTEALVIVGVTLVAIFANIAYAVLGGACFCAWMFAWNMGRDFKVEESYSDGTKIYDITGPLFFTSANKLVKILDPNADPDRVEVHLALSSVMDYSGMEAMNKVHLAYKKAGKSIQFQSVNAHSQRMITKAMKLWSDLDYQQEQKQKQVQPEPEQPDQKQVQPELEQRNFPKTKLAQSTRL